MTIYIPRCSLHWSLFCQRISHHQK